MLHKIKNFMNPIIPFKHLFKIAKTISEEKENDNKLDEKEEVIIDQENIL